MYLIFVLMMNPRIYTYKITFEDSPFWYWGVHKERKYNETYWGSPVTKKWYWNFYSPQKQILEIFEYSDVGWKQALDVEKRLILPDLNNPLCLNASCGMGASLEILRENGKKLVECMHSNKNELGQSLHAIKMGKNGGKKQPMHVKIQNGLKAKEQKLGFHGMSKEDRMELSRETGLKQKLFKKGIHAQTYEEKREMGKKSSSYRYIDPNHPELGSHSAPVLARKQKSYGYPSGRDTRVRIL